MAYTLTAIAASYNRPVSTTCKHIQELKDKGLFKKESPGKQFNDDELHKLQVLMKFKYKEQK